MAQNTVKPEKTGFGMAITARLRPVFCVFRPKIPRTFYFKLTEQSSRKKLAVGGFEPEKVRLLYPAPLKKPVDLREVSASAEGVFPYFINIFRNKNDLQLTAVPECTAANLIDVSGQYYFAIRAYFLWLSDKTCDPKVKCVQSCQKYSACAGRSEYHPFPRQF